MQIKQLAKQYYVLGNGAIAFTIIDFEISGIIDGNGRNVVHEFINSPEDFEFARKYVGGYHSDDTNQFGIRNISKVYGFGPYLIDTLELEDYKKITVEEFENRCIEMLSESNLDNEIEFMANVKNAFKNLKINSHDFYQLLPEEWKYNDISPFQLSSYLCAFSINKIDGIFSVIQIDDN